MITRALVRPPSSTYASGLTAAGLGPPDLATARAQHAAYVEALRAAGVTVDAIPPDDRYPDSTFVEDVAVMTERGAILARPGAPSRRGEVDAIREAIEERLPVLGAVEAPGCLDGGDVCEAGSRVLVGISDRTNGEGASQLASLLALSGLRTVVLDVRRIPGLLHLKTGMAYVGEGRALAWEALAGHEALRGLDVIVVPKDEAYAANAIRVRDRVLVPEGFPRVLDTLTKRGLTPFPVPMSEFRKMDGGLSCLSLRW
ncbi:MAG TPA: arginine deiminase family protein [Candidatus Polarisedimenticolaceae bacterium]|nr:arginine deiminase family protein [Candidatus Polarisedimenticolaceae bacterium]